MAESSKKSIRTIPPPSPADRRAAALPIQAGRPARVPPREVTVHDNQMFCGSEADTLREITRLYLKALEAQRARDGLLTVAAHELRQPLHLMRAALARYRPEPQDPARQALEGYLNRMARLVDDLADFVRTDRDELELQLEWLDLGRLLHELVDEYHSTFCDRGVRLTLIEPQGDCRINADAQRLLQIFSNLLDNALKFTPSGGTVTIAAQATGATVDVRIRDTGRGLEDGVTPRVQGFRGAIRAGGQGIGLAIARRITELHGGSIAVRSDGPAKGTEVVVTLPRLEDCDGS